MMRHDRRCIAVLSFALVLTSLTACTSPESPGPSPSSGAEHLKAFAAREHARDTIVDLSKIEDGLFQEVSAGTPNECGSRDDEGVVFSWATTGGASTDPERYADRAADLLERDGFQVSRDTMKRDDGRDVYYIGALNADGRHLSVYASAANTLLNVASACAEGTAAEFGN